MSDPSARREQLLAAAYAAVLAEVRYRLGDGPDADDLIQNTMLRIIRRLAKFDPLLGRIEWFARMNLNSVISHGRQARHRRPTTSFDEVSALKDAPTWEPADHRTGREEIDRDLAADVRDALAELAPCDRAALVADVEDIKPKNQHQVAARKKALGPALRRARRRFERLGLGEYVPVPLLTNAEAVERCGMSKGRLTWFKRTDRVAAHTVGGILRYTERAVRIAAGI